MLLMAVWDEVCTEVWPLAEMATQFLVQNSTPKNVVHPVCYVPLVSGGVWRKNGRLSDETPLNKEDATRTDVRNS